MRYALFLLIMIFSINSIHSQPYEQTIDNAIMDKFVEIQDKFLELDEKIDLVDSYIILLISCNSFLTHEYYHIEYSDIRDFIQQVFDSEESDLVTKLFNEYDIKNGFYKFVIASVIVNILIYENMFLGNHPEFVEYINRINDNYIVDDKKFDIYLENVNGLLQMFNKKDVELIRKYMGPIIQNFKLHLED